MSSLSKYIGLVLWIWTTAAYTQSLSQQEAYSEITQMKLSQGRATLAAVPEQNGFSAYLESYADMIELMSAEDINKYEPFLDQQKKRIELIEEQANQTPYSLFLMAEVKLHTAFVKLKFGHDVKGAWDIIRAYKLLAENAEKYPNFLPNKKSLGLLHILIGSSPENYGWVLKILGLKGNIKLGLQELDNVIAQDPFWKNEATLIKYLAEIFVLKASKQDIDQFQAFVKANSDNQLFVFFGVSALVKEGRAEAALQILQGRQQGREYFPLHFLEFQKAEILLMKGQYAQATGSYQMFLSKHKGFNFLKDTHYKIFLCFWLQNQDSQGLIFLEKINNIGQTYVEADKAAQKFVETFTKKSTQKKLPEKNLLKARLSCDGGFYEQALAVLQTFQENSFVNPRDRAEFNYRKGRIYQRMERIDQAIPFFERGILLSQVEGWSFGASSALQLGYIYQEKKQKAKSKAYFEKAISFKKHEYKNSTDNKAKAALNEL
jgi:hypothetical protein